jgi:ribonuclease J
LLSDSTNAEREGYTPSERTVRGDLDRIFSETPGKLFFSTFSSHVHRLSQVIELSQRYGRRIITVGRSMNNSIKLGTQLGYLEYPPSLFAEVGDLKQLAPHEVTLLITGSQGEPLSALIRIAEGDHKQVKMEPDDAVILSSRIIPGNEKSIGNMINHLYRRGAMVHHSHNAAVHVSGHASQEELKLLLRLVHPRYFVPVHGEYRHLVQHRAVAQTVGMRPEATFLMEDGNVLEIDAQEARVAASVQAGRVFVDGKGIGDVEDIVLRDRRHLSSDGLVLAILAIDQHSGEIISGPDLVTRGFIPEEGGQAYLERAKIVVIEALQQVGAESRTDSLEVKEEVRKALKRFFAKTLERRPVIVPFVMEM